MFVALITIAVILILYGAVSKPLLSVFLHGLSSVPLVAAYSRWYTAHVADHPSAPGQANDHVPAAASPGTAEDQTGEAGEA